MSTLGSFAREGDMFYEMPVDKDYYYDVPYHRNPESGDLAFGTKKSISGGMVRHSLKELGFEQRKWAEIEVFENKLIFVESWAYRIFFKDLKTKEFSRVGDIFIDKISPAPDTRGKAPYQEVNKTRYRLKERLKNGFSDKCLFRNDKVKEKRNRRS